MARRASASRGGVRRRRPGVEGLESRRLLSSAAVISEYAVPGVSNPNVPGTIAVGPDGNLYFSQGAVQISRLGQTITYSLYELNTTTHAVTKLPLPSQGSIGAIAAGPGNTVWIVGPAGGQISVLNVANGTYSEIAVPAGVAVQDFVLGPDGNMWFTDSPAGKVGVIDATTHAFQEFPLAKSTSRPGGITVGPDGEIWFSEFANASVGEINTTTHAIAEYPLSTSTAQPGQIIAGPDGNVWFTASDTNGVFSYIGKFDVATHTSHEFAAGGERRRARAGRPYLVQRRGPHRPRLSGLLHRR